ncbi:MAG: SidA/IucD/PvdA family monooxygenase [Acidobacteriota bacterium]
MRIASSHPFDQRNPVDLLGIGFGPSNLALAAAVQEELVERRGERLSTLFLESKPGFAWHPGMLMEDARIQLSFLKDISTLRDPGSRYTFLRYLQEKGRLDQFINLRNFFPTRIEFCDYYAWVAQQLDDQVQYGVRVEGVEPVTSADGERVELLRVSARDEASGELHQVLAKNLVVATGGIPFLPPGVDLEGSERVFHSKDFLTAMTGKFLDRQAPHRFAVVGSGQTAAEVFQYLYTHYPNAEVTATVRRFAYKPADDSHFVNEIFFPEMVDKLYEMSPRQRDTVLSAHMDTNYSAVDLDLIQEIYEALYQRRVEGDERVKIRPFLELRGIADGRDSATLRFFNLVDEAFEFLEVDGAVLATGYHRPRNHRLLEALGDHLERDAGGHYLVDRNYRVMASDDFTPGIFLQGFCEDTHGLSDTLLSTLPARSMEILDSLRGVPRPRSLTRPEAEAAGS